MNPKPNSARETGDRIVPLGTGLQLECGRLRRGAGHLGGELVYPIDPRDAGS